MFGVKKSYLHDYVTQKAGPYWSISQIGPFGSKRKWQNADKSLMFGWYQAVIVLYVLVCTTRLFSVL